MVDIDEDPKEYLPKNLDAINSVSLPEKNNSLLCIKEHKNKTHSIFPKKKRKFELIGIFLFIIMTFIIASLIVYLIFYFQINKINTILYNNDLPHTNYDPRLYEVIALNNGIEVALINNFNSSICSFGMTVGGGYSNDGEVLGLGNLVKHLFVKNLTLSSNGEFTETLSQNFGKFNAYYKDNSTTFSFEIEKSGFNDALKLFSKFLLNFKSTKDNIDASISTIETELGRIRLERDILEKQVLYEVIFNTTKGYFPYGSRYSFDGHSNLTDMVDEYIRKAFVGKNIKIAIYSNQRLNLIKGQAIKYFSSLPKGEEISNCLIEKKELHLGKVVLLLLDKAQYQYLSVSFYFDRNEFPLCELYLKYFQYLLNDKSENSLYYSLVTYSLIRSMSTSVNIYYPSTVEFKIQIETINTLYEKEEQNETISLIYNYFISIQADKFKEYHEKLYKEFRKINSQQFVYQPFPNDLSGYATDVSLSLFNFSSDYRFPYGKNYMPHFDQEIIKKILNHFTYNHSVILIGGDNFDNFEEWVFSIAKREKKDMKTNYKNETYYLVKYSDSDFNETAIKGVITTFTGSAFEIRKSNKFITKYGSNEILSYHDTPNEHITTLINLKHLHILYKVNLIFIIVIGRFTVSFT